MFLNVLVRNQMSFETEEDSRKAKYAK